MEFKHVRKVFSRFAARMALYSCSLIARHLPTQWVYGSARLIAAVGFHLAGRHRRVALQSLRIAFSREFSEAQLRAIAYDSFVIMAKSGIELFYLMDKPAQIKERVVFENRAYLDQALERGKGVILLSAHFGNFPLLLMRLSVEGFAAGGIIRPMRDAKADAFVTQYRTRLGVKTIYSQPREVCVATTIKSLRNNEIVFIPLDQNFGTGGVFVTFFGRKAATATGPVILAQRTGAAVVPCFLIRQADDTHRMVFLKPFEVEKGEGAVERNTQELTTIIERYIRRYPAEWSWIHRRWKSQPAEGQEKRFFT